MVAVVQTQNADSAVTALNTDTIYSLLSPAGIAVVPGSVKALLGLLAPTPAPSAAATTTTDTTTTTTAPTDSSSTQAAAAPSPTGGSSTSIGAIVGGVVGGLAVVAIGVAVFVVSRAPLMSGQFLLTGCSLLQLISKVLFTVTASQNTWAPHLAVLCRRSSAAARLLLLPPPPQRPASPLARTASTPPLLEASQPPVSCTLLT